MTRTKIWVAALATSALTAFASGAARADDTTVIREHRVVQAPAPVAQPAPQTTAVTTTVHRTSVSRQRVSTGPVTRLHHVVRHHHPVARQTTTVVEQQQQTQPAQAPAADAAAQPAAATIDRKTVIHRDDNGDVSRHTVIQKQDSDGNQTTVEHRSTTTPDTPPHADEPPHS
jgi:hypothetical protein